LKRKLLGTALVFGETLEAFDANELLLGSIEVFIMLLGSSISNLVLYLL